MSEMVHGAVPARTGEPVLPRWWRTVDKGSIGAVLLLFGIGLLLGLAASPPLAEKTGLPPFHYVQRQAVFGVVSLLVLALTSMMRPELIRRLGVVGFFAAFAALVLLPVFGTDFGKGAVRWYSLGFASLQPSEFLKPGFVILAAWMVAASQERTGPPGRLLSLAIALVVTGFLALQPDFGQAALIVFTWGVIVFVAGAPFLVLFALTGAVAAAGVVAYTSSAHVASRIDGFLSPEVAPRTQLGYAIDAIREGGLFGVGAGEGQVKWSLPDAHTDFIIAIAAEEYGLLLVLVIVALYAVIVLRSLWRLTRERDAFIRLAGTGLAATFGVQALVNIGVAVRMLPAKGMTLPFISYGGSSLLAAGIAMGMLLALTRRRPQGEIGDHLGRRP